MGYLTSPTGDVSNAGRDYPTYLGIEPLSIDRKLSAWLGYRRKYVAFIGIFIRLRSLCQGWRSCPRYTETIFICRCTNIEINVLDK